MRNLGTKKWLRPHKGEGHYFVYAVSNTSFLVVKGNCFIPFPVIKANPPQSAISKLPEYLPVRSACVVWEVRDLHHGNTQLVLRAAPDGKKSGIVPGECWSGDGLYGVVGCPRLDLD